MRKKTLQIFRYCANYLKDLFLYYLLASSKLLLLLHLVAYAQSSGQGDGLLLWISSSATVLYMCSTVFHSCSFLPRTRFRLQNFCEGCRFAWVDSSFTFNTDINLNHRSDSTDSSTWLTCVHLLHLYRRKKEILGIHQHINNRGAMMRYTVEDHSLGLWAEPRKLTFLLTQWQDFLDQKTCKNNSKFESTRKSNLTWQQLKVFTSRSMLPKNMTLYIFLFYLWLILVHLLVLLLALYS